MVLIVDGDLGFLFWLGQLLAQAGYQTLPALSCAEALFHIKALGVGIDDVIVEQGLRGASEMLQELARTNGSLRIILIGNRAMHLPTRVRADMTIQRPLSWELPSSKKWMMKLETVLAGFHSIRQADAVTFPRS